MPKRTSGIPRKITRLLSIRGKITINPYKRRIPCTINFDPRTLLWLLLPTANSFLPRLNKAILTPA